MMVDEFFKYWTVGSILFAASFILTVLVSMIIYMLHYFRKLKQSCHFNEYGIELFKFRSDTKFFQYLLGMDLLTLDKVMDEFHKQVSGKLIHYIRNEGRYSVCINNKCVHVIDLKTNKVIIYLSSNNIVINNHMYFITLTHYRIYVQWIRSLSNYLNRKLNNC